jgi:Uma2 family endonuclease
MSTITPAQHTQTPEPLASAAIYRMTVDQYEQMAKVLGDARVELIDGYLVNKMSKYPPHIWTVDAIREMLQRLLPTCWCRKEDPVRIPEFDEPEPDVAVVRGTRDDYLDRIPGPADIKLLVEVSDSTLDRDRGVKSVAYAKNLIPIYWIVNLVEQRIEVYTLPGPGGYASRVDFKPGEDIPVVLDGIEIGTIAVASVLPAR